MFLALFLYVSNCIRMQDRVLQGAVYYDIALHCSCLLVDQFAKMVQLKLPKIPNWKYVKRW